ncbi:hypothetical protein GCM10023080_080800 [Streptomyces pseudoechinosporeus]
MAVAISPIQAARAVTAALILARTDVFFMLRILFPDLFPDVVIVV